MFKTILRNINTKTIIISNKLLSAQILQIINSIINTRVNGGSLPVLIIVLLTPWHRVMITMITSMSLTFMIPNKIRML